MVRSIFVSRRVVLATLALSVLDLAFNVVLWRWVAGAPAATTVQVIASGLLGPVAFELGASSVLLGLALHVASAWFWSLAYAVISPRVAWATSHPLAGGAL